MKIHSKKHMKLFSALVIGSVSLFALSGCNSEARYSEHLEWDGTLTQEEPKVEDSVTIEFKLTYSDGSVASPQGYETLYASGSWSLKEDGTTWSDPVPLTWVNESQTYDLTLTDVAHDTYQCQLLFGYTHLGTYDIDWNYRITEDGSNLNVIINGATTEVDVTLEKSITEYIPIYRFTLTDYRLNFTFMLSEAAQTIPSYANVYIYGSWDNPTDADWSVYHELTLDSDGYTYYYTISSIDALADGSEWYHYSIVLGYSELGHPDWDYTLVNNGSLNITGYETDNYIDIPITLDQSLETTIPEITVLTNYTLTFAFTYNGASITAPDYVSVYYLGGLEGESWGDGIELTAAGDGTYTLTFESINVGTYEYALMIDYSGQSGVTWTEGQIITSSNQTFTVSVGQGNDYVSDTITIASEIDISSLLPDVVFTYVITFYHNGTKLGAAGDGIDLYAAGTYDVDEYSQWTTTKLDNNGDGTYNLVIHFIPVKDTYFNIYVDDTTDSSQNMWSYILGTYTIPELGDSGTGVFTHEISIEASHSSIDDLLHPTGTNFYIVVLNSDSGNSSLSSKFTTLHFQTSDWQEENTFDGSATSSLTSTTTSGGQDAIYNTTVGVAEPGSTHNAYLYTLSGNQWANQVDISITIPETSDGTIAVYLCDYDASSSSPSVSTTLSDGTTAGWETNISGTIEDYITGITEDHRASSSGGSTETDSGYYYFIFDVSLSSGFSSITTLSTGKNSFGGSTSSSVTAGTTPASQSYICNTVAGSYPSGSNGDSYPEGKDWFTFHDGQWGNQLGLGDLTCPTISEGGLAIYVGVGINNSSSDQVWAGNTNVPGYNSSNGAWVTSYNSLSAFLNDCTNTINSIW